ncbi:Multidrug resistance protein MdtH [Lysinibacillus sphaericus]
MSKLSTSAKVYLAIVFIVLYAPIFYLVFYSFNSGDSMTNFQSFTLDHYKAVFEDSRLLVILINTVIVALLSALISTIIGTLGAIGIVTVKDSKMRNTLLSLNNVLIVSPDVIIGASFLILFTMVGIKLGFASVLLAHVAFSVPIVGAAGQVLGMLIATFALAQFVFSPIAGNLSDRYGRKNLIIFGLIVTGLGQISFGLSTDVWMLFVARFLGGLGSAFVAPPIMAFVADVTTYEERGKGMGMLGAAMSLGFMIGTWYWRVSIES